MQLTHFLEKHFVKILVFTLGGRVHVKGLENIPKDREDLCFIGNHQSYLDILTLQVYNPYFTGFIAKKELAMVPVINLWMAAKKCILLDRKSLRKSNAAIDRGAANIRNGHPMIIFPEGHRSKSSEMAPFRKGSLKLALRSGACICPFTINGTYKVWEESGRLKKADIYLQYHPAIDVQKLSKEEQETLSEKLEETIRNGLKQ